MSKQEIPTTLSQKLFEYLQGEQLVLLGTVDAESNAPSVNAISWVKSLSEQKIRFTVTNNSRIVTNIKNNPNVVFTVIALDTVYSINGKANILEETMQNVPLKLAKIEVDIEHVFESMFWGAKIVQHPTYEKTYNEKKAKKLDEQVYEALMGDH